MSLVNQDYIRAAWIEEIKMAGSATKLAAQMHMGVSFIREVADGRSEPSTRVLDRLGYRLVKMYEKKIP